MQGSIEDERALAQAFEARPQWVFHLAALFANQNSVDHPQRDLAVNGGGTVKVLQQAVAGRQIVEHGHLVAALDQQCGQVRSDRSGPARHQDARHGESSASRSR